jgi:GMP synthase PP-ATPase subunit
MQINISMHKFIRNILLIIFIQGFRYPPATHDITVKLRVHGNDARLTEKIFSDLRSDLGNKSNIVIVSDTTDSSAFTITVQYATLKTGDKLVAFFINSLLTRRIRTSKDESADQLIKSSVSSTANVSDIDRLCAKFVDEFDVQYFEKERIKTAR